jgi:Zn-finger nucleic acid-binding protein
LKLVKADPIIDLAGRAPLAINQTIAMSDRIEFGSMLVGLMVPDRVMDIGDMNMTNPGAGMPCPVCAVPLVMSERQVVEIDYCPQCRGVWLDRGELDKIIERNARAAAPPAPPQTGAWDRQGHYGQKPYKRRKSFLEELFD